MAGAENSNYHGSFIVALISLTAWPLMKCKEILPILADPTMILIFGATTLMSLYMLMTVLLPPEKDKKISRGDVFSMRGPLYYWCAVSSWSCMIDLAFFLEVNGSITGFMDYYLVNGEAYFQTPYGALSLLWDAGPHFLMYLMMIYKIDSKQNCKHIALAWGGFMIVSVFTLLFGALCGKYSKDLHPASFLNIPYAALPLYFVFKAFLCQEYAPRTRFDVNDVGVIGNLCSLVGSFLLIASGFINWIRALGALGSSLPLAVLYTANYEPYLLDDTKFGGSYVIFAIHIGTILQVHYHDMYIV